MVELQAALLGHDRPRIKQLVGLRGGPKMRLTHWGLGIVLGGIAGGSALIVGVLALLVVVPGVVWAARELR